MNFEIKTQGNPLPWLRRVQAELQSSSGSRVTKSMGVAAAKTVRDHFRRLDQSRHRGFSTRNFYGNAAGATDYEISGGDIAVVVGDGQFPGNAIALRFHGGTVKPTGGRKWLTIPVDDASQGRRIREFGDAVQFIVNRRTKKGVAKLGDRVLYALTQEAKHKPDDSVLPDADTFAEAMAEAADQTIDRMRRQS